MKKTKKLDFIELYSDSAFKYFFKHDKLKYWFIDIIKEKTGIDLSKYHLTNNEINTGSILKDCRMDITLTDSKNLVIIEMQNDYYKSAIKKAFYYMFFMTGSLLESGNNFKESGNITLIMFNNFKEPSGSKKEKLSHELQANEIYHKYDFLKSYQIYLPEYYNKSYNSLSKIDKRLYLFNCKDFKEMHDIIDNEEDLKILKRLEELCMDEKFIKNYDAEKVNKKLMNSIKEEGFEEGIEQGIEKRNFEIACNSLKQKLSIDTISSITGLSIQQINSIKL